MVVFQIIELEDQRLLLSPHSGLSIKGSCHFGRGNIAWIFMSIHHKDLKFLVRGSSDRQGSMSIGQTGYAHILPSISHQLNGGNLYAAILFGTDP